jgi:hypothetical protein
MKSLVRTPKEQHFDIQEIGIIVATPSRIMLVNLIKVVLCWICKPRKWCLFLWNNEKHITRGQKCCHIVLFSNGVHVWTSTIVTLEHIFPNFLHNMVDFNTKNSTQIFFKKKLILCNFNVYLWQKIVHHYVLKNTNILKKWLKWFLIFMKFVIFIKHCDSIWLK